MYLFLMTYLFLLKPSGDDNKFKTDNNCVNGVFLDIGCYEISTLTKLCFKIKTVTRTLIYDTDYKISIDVIILTLSRYI